jgi:hypothetical protein
MRSRALPPRFRRDLIRRTAVLWVGARFLATMILLMVASMMPRELQEVIPIRPFGPGVVVGVLVLIVALSYADVAVCRERFLFANLGISRARIARFALGMACALEGALLLARFMIGRLA